jgi:hypothetical protein
MKIVKEEQAQIVSQELEMECRMTLCIRQSEAEKFKARLQKIEYVRLV